MCKSDGAAARHAPSSRAICSADAPCAPGGWPNRSSTATKLARASSSSACPPGADMNRLSVAHMDGLTGAGMNGLSPNGLDGDCVADSMPTATGTAAACVGYCTRGGDGGGGGSDGCSEIDEDRWASSTPARVGCCDGDGGGGGGGGASTPPDVVFLSPPVTLRGGIFRLVACIPNV